MGLGEPGPCYVVAVITSILASEQPRRAAEELKQALLEAMAVADAINLRKENKIESGRGISATGGNGQA